MSDCVQYDEPFAWWGPVWTPPAASSIVDLIREEMLRAETAGLLWALLARRASLIVVAGPSGAGKTTLLTALLEFLPPGTRRIYLRGCYEPFAFLDDATIDPRRTVLLVNEISAHLPAYLWGPGVRRTLEAAHRGFALAATAHATSATELIQTWAGYPLRVPLPAIAAVDLVVHLDAWMTNGLVRREVASVTALEPSLDGRGLTLAVLSDRSSRITQPDVDLRRTGAVVARLGSTEAEDGIGREIAERAAALAALATADPGQDRPSLEDLARRWEPAAGMG